MKAKELKTKKEKELHDLLREKRIQLRELRFKTSSGRLADNKAIKNNKREVARIMTILKEKSHA